MRQPLLPVMMVFPGAVSSRVREFQAGPDTCKLWPLSDSSLLPQGVAVRVKQENVGTQSITALVL